MPVEGSCQHSCGDNSSFDEVILFLKKAKRQRLLTIFGGSEGFLLTQNVCVRVAEN